MVDIGSYLQQSLDYLGVSIVSSFLQRNTAILYENMRDKRTVIAGGDHHCRTEKEREREAKLKDQNTNEKSLVHKECRIQVHKKDMCSYTNNVPRQ